MPLYMPGIWRVILITGTAVLGALGSFAQSRILRATGDRPSFEVATIKPWKRPPAPLPSADGGVAPVKVMKASPVGGGGQATNRVHMILPAALLIASAYNLPVGSESRLVRGPGWLQQQTEQFEIDAKIEDSVYAAMRKMSPAQQREQVALMEQSLLAERFQLQMHIEAVEMPVYALVAAKGGSKLIAAKNGEASGLSTVRDEQGMKMTATAVTVDDFVRSPLLTGSAGGRQVVDQTGLKGAYDFALAWAPETVAAPETANAADGPSLFTAIQEQLGLRLVPSKAQVEVIVVDYIERPSSN